MIRPMPIKIHDTPLGIASLTLYGPTGRRFRRYADDRDRAPASCTHRVNAMLRICVSGFVLETPCVLRRIGASEVEVHL